MSLVNAPDVSVRLENGERPLHPRRCAHAAVAVDTSSNDSRSVMMVWSWGWNMFERRWSWGWSWGWPGWNNWNMFFCLMKKRKEKSPKVFRRIKPIENLEKGLDLSRLSRFHFEKKRVKSKKG